MEVDDDIEVTVQVLTDAEILEDFQGDTVVVGEDNEEEGTAKDEAPVKSSNEEVRHAIETLHTYSLVTENWELGAMATKIFSVVQSELTRFSKQMTIKSFFKKD